MKLLTKEDIKEALRESGVVTKQNFKVLLKEYGVVTKRDLNKVEKELVSKISNVAVNSPTSGMFNKLEKRVANLEASVN